MVTNYKTTANGVIQFVSEPTAHESTELTGEQLEKAAMLQAEIVVRQYRLMDVPSISSLPHRYEMHHPESDGENPRPLPLLVRRLLSGDNSHTPLYVAIHRPSREILGALQCRQYAADERWHLQYMLGLEPVDYRNPVAISLLEFAISEAGWRGARRLMTRAEVESPISGSLRFTGFTAFGREGIYRMSGVPVGELGGDVRMQRKPDVWGIHQLYIRTTPRDVQNAEALTSHEWDIDLDGLSRRGWFHSAGNGPMAYVRVTTTRRLHRLDVMFEPTAMSQLAEVLETVFAVLWHESPRQVFIAVRGYQQELEVLLKSLGFDYQSDQLMMVRYTTMPVSLRPTEAFEPLPAAETERVRVPSFYMRDVHE